MTTVCKRAVFLLCQRVLAPVSERVGSPMPDRQHDISQLTAGVLERTRRDLRISLTLIAPGSPARGARKCGSGADLLVLQQRAGLGYPIWHGWWSLPG